MDESREPWQGLTIDSNPDGDVVWVTISGEIDLVNREELLVGLARLEFGSARLVFLDVGRLMFCDGVGYLILASFREDTAVAGYDVRFVHASALMRKVLGLFADSR